MDDLFDVKELESYRHILEQAIPKRLNTKMHDLQLQMSVLAEEFDKINKSRC